MKREIYKLLSSAKQGMFTVLALLSVKASSQNFVYTGSTQSVSLPAGNYSIQCWGADGGSANNGSNIIVGGKGGYSMGVFTNPSTATINVYVGGRGGNAAGAAQVGSGGGGMSDVAAASNTNIIIIAAGGGGGSTSGGTLNENSTGGDAGGTTGATAIDGAGVTGGTAATGGSQIAGGSATAGSYGVGTPGGFGYGGGAANGGLDGVIHGAGGAGGNGGAGGWNGGGGGCILTGINDHAGGGGSGYYGGGGGRGDGGAGGGGSSYIGGVSSGATIMFGQPGFVPNPDLTGNGYVIITALCNISLSSISANGQGLICSGSSATITTDAVSNFNWSTGAGTSSIVVSPTITTSYTLTATSQSNCVASAVITITVDNTPTVTAVSNPTAVCAGKTATLTATGATSYTWAGSVPVTNGVSFTPVSTGNYTVTGGNACGTSTAVASITVNPLPNITASANNPTVCYGAQVVLTGTGSAGGYTWTGGVTNNSAFTPPVGTNTYVVTGNSLNNCTNTAVVTVTVFQTPTITPVATPSAICAGKTATVTAVGAVNGYTWTTVPPVYTNTMAVSPVVTTTYAVIRASSACTSIATVTVVVNPLPNLLVTAPNPSVNCAGTCATLTGQGAITYTWFPGGFQGGVITVCPNSSTDYTVVASNANCTTSATSSVTILPNPVVSIQASTTTPCAGSQITMTVTGASSYTWDSPISVPQQNQNVVTHSPSAPIQYTVIGMDANGCTSIANQVILPQTAPNLSLSIANTGSFICAGDAGTLIAQGTGPVNYNWQPAGGSASIAIVNPAVSTVYTVTGINSGNGCMSIGTLSLAVYISTFVVSSPTAVCKGNTATLSVAGAANNYTWNAGSPNNNDSIFVSPPNNTVYYVTGITGSCSTTQSVNLVVNPIPPVTAVPQKITICRFEPAVLSGSGATSYIWTGGPGATTPNYTVFPQVTTTYTLAGTDNNGCSKTVQVTQLVATCIGIEEQSPLAGLLSIYPNPSQGEFTIQAETDMNISILNELGQTVKTFSLSQKENKVQIHDLANGIYFIRAEKDGNTGIKKIILTR
jgi:hypothetical protein